MLSFITKLVWTNSQIVNRKHQVISSSTRIIDFQNSSCELKEKMTERQRTFRLGLTACTPCTALD